MITDIREKNIENDKLIYSDISYKIIGAAFTVYNELGFGHMEKIYQRALAKELHLQNLNFKEQVSYKVLYKGENIGNSFLDFLVEDKVIVELKKCDHFSKKNIDQVVNYLKISDLKLAMLINFSKNGVLHKRLVNLNENPK
ncbi:MAG TPA: GxxExxY protein [Bacteroidia bacterium]|jgi:GxxExxY protein|nr:GxxExxY protein [Bacteroidia bacterium]